MTTVPQSIQEQIQQLEPSAVIELYQLQLTAAVNGVDATYYYHDGSNELNGNIVFNSICSNMDRRKRKYCILFSPSRNNSLNSQYSHDINRILCCKKFCHRYQTNKMHCFRMWFTKWYFGSFCRNADI